MAFCEQCGAELKAGQQFCAQCGTPVNGAANTGNGENGAAKTASIDTAKIKESSAGAVALFKALPGKVKGGIIGAVVLLIVIVCALVNLSKTIDMNDYVTVKFTGYDTMGHAKVELDEDAFMEDFAKKAKLDSKAKKAMKDYDLDDLYDMFSEGYSMYDIDDKIDYELDKDSELTNGDEVVLSWDIDKEYIKKHYGVNIKGKDKKFKTEDLDEVQSFNPFDDLTVKFAGVSGNGTCELTVDSEDEIYDYITFSVDGSNLSEGDKVKVKFGSNYGESLGEYCAENYGKVPTETSKTYKVEGLGKYVEKCDQLTEDVISELTKQAVDIVTTDIGYEDSVTITGSENLGTYVMTKKNGESNKVGMVVKYDCSINEEDGQDNFTFFSIISFKNVVVNSANEFTYDILSYDTYDNQYNRYESSISNGWWNKSYSYNGFASLDELNSYVTKRNSKEYNIDTTVQATAEDAAAEDAEAEGEAAETEAAETEAAE